MRQPLFNVWQGISVILALIIFSFCLFTVGIKLGHATGYNDGYAANALGGYYKGYQQGVSDTTAKNYDQQAVGYTNGQTDTLNTILDWEQSACTPYSNGYYEIKFWRSSADNTVHYTCIVFNNQY